MSRTAQRGTPAQQERIAELQDENGYPRLYPQHVQGKTIIGQFRRYVTREDTSCIGQALYNFLRLVCGFIAESGLIPPDGGFRLVWAEPAALIDELANGGRAQRDYRRVERVYQDGMTDVEVLAAIDQLASDHEERCRAARTQRAFQRDISVAVKLLEPHHFTIVPPGWTLANPGRQPSVEQPAGSLAAALVQLAASNGLFLTAPPGADSDGQIRLL